MTMMMTTTMTTTTQGVTMMVVTRQTKMSKTMRKWTSTNLHEISMPALKTWMNGLNHCPAEWRVWRKTKKRKHLNDLVKLSSVPEIGWSDKYLLRA